MIYTYLLDALYSEQSSISIYRPSNGVQQNGLYNDGVATSISTLRPVPASSPITSRFYNQCKFCIYIYFDLVK